MFSKLSRVFGSEINLHPAYCSLLIDFDPLKREPHAFMAEIENHAANTPLNAELKGKIVNVPVLYGGDNGPDLKEIAQHTGLSEEEVLRSFNAGEYRVAFLGFTPGFPYLLGLPDHLRSPRKSTPRLRVPAGSVALAGQQTGIYPADSPGGWQLIGRTQLPLFDPSRATPALLQPGDRVIFEPQHETPKPQPPAKSSFVPRAPSFEVLQPGLFSTVQDQGRDGYTHLGVSPGGAADPLALRAGNHLLGNRAESAAIELTAQGASFKILRDTWIAVTGAETAVRLGDRELPMWTAAEALAGQTLKIGTIAGLRAYLCVRGGIEVEPRLGSRSTFQSGAWGGFEGRALRVGDKLGVGDLTESEISHRQQGLFMARLYSEAAGILRVTKGPQWDWFSEAARRDFFAREYEVTSEANRLGLRLNGRALDYAPEKRGEELLTEGIASGAIQVPAGGQPLILFCEQRTTGGYPKIANVIRADWWRLGQLKPGDKIHFKEVEYEEAWRLNLEQEDALRRAGYVG